MRYKINLYNVELAKRKIKICLESLQHKDILNRQKLEALRHLREIKWFAKKSKPQQPQKNPKILSKPNMGRSNEQNLY